MPSFEVTLTPDELASEIWLPVGRYNGHYEISNMGRVKSLKFYHGRVPGLILKQKIDWDGYLTIDLCLNSQYGRIFVHKLVALHFVGPRPYLHECNHEDTDKKNNRWWNLKWVTKEENMQHASRNGLTARGDRHGLRIHKGAASNGEKHSEATRKGIPRGDRHWTRRNPGCHAGAKNPQAKFSPELRQQICAEYIPGVFGYIRLGKKFGIQSSTIEKIIKSERRRSV